MMFKLKSIFHHPKVCIALAFIYFFEFFSIFLERYKEVSNSGDVYGNLFTSYQMVDALKKGDWQLFLDLFYFARPIKGLLLAHWLMPLAAIIKNPWWVFIISTCILNFLLATALFFLFHKQSQRYILPALATLFILNFSYVWIAVTAYASYLFFFCFFFLLIQRIVSLGRWPQKVDALCVFYVVLCFGSRHLDSSIMALAALLLFPKWILQSRTTWLTALLVFIWWVPGIPNMMRHFSSAQALIASAPFQFYVFFNEITFLIMALFLLNLFFLRKYLLKKTVHLVALFFYLSFVSVAFYAGTHLLNIIYVVLAFMLFLLAQFIVIVQSPWKKSCEAILACLISYFCLVQGNRVYGWGWGDLWQPQFQLHHTDPSTPRLRKEAEQIALLLKEEKVKNLAVLYDTEGFENNLEVGRSLIIFLKMTQINLYERASVPFLEGESTDKDFDCDYNKTYDMALVIVPQDRKGIPSYLQGQFVRLKNFSYGPAEVVFNSEKNDSRFALPYDWKLVRLRPCDKI